VRAFDARTGRLRWSWDPVPAALGAGAANAWSVLSADPERDLVFVPTGAPAPTSTAASAWAPTPTPTPWSRWTHPPDVSCGPSRSCITTCGLRRAGSAGLFTLRRGGSSVPAVAVATKMGHLFILDRVRSTLFPIEERPVPASDVPGEAAWPTQPFPVPALRLAPESLAAADAFARRLTPRRQCRDRIAALRYDGVFTPPSLRGTIIFPGTSAA